MGQINFGFYNEPGNNKANIQSILIRVKNIYRRYFCDALIFLFSANFD